MTVARAAGHIPSVENGEDAIYYQIVPSTLVVSLDANGNWADDTKVNSKKQAIVTCKAYKVVGSVRQEVNNLFIVSKKQMYYNQKQADVIVYADNNASSQDIKLCEVKSQSSGGVITSVPGDTLAIITISINRAGKNGSSVTIQYSADGSTNWQDEYFAGAKYIRIYSDGKWSSAMKLVGDDGTSFLITGSFDSKEGLPASGAKLGDAYLIGGNLWVYVAYTGEDTTKHYRGFENVGNIKGPKGDSVTVKSTTVYYGISASGTDYGSVTDWQTSVQNITADKPYLWTKTVVTFSSGQPAITYSVTTRGNKGATFRQHTDFEEGEYSYQSGSGVEEFIDVICINNHWYRCVKSYTSTSKSDVNNNVTKTEYWTSDGVNGMTFVATHLLLAENATINMLGTNEINLFDSNSNMFGSFRVPHGDASVSGDRDSGKYALWIGAEIGSNAPFSVTKNGELWAYSGTIGGLEIYNHSDTKKGLHYEREESDLYPRSRMAITRDSLLIGAEGGNAALYGATVEICPWGGSQIGNTTKAWNFSEPALTVVKNLANSPFAYDCQTAMITSYGCNNCLNEGFAIDAKNGSDVIAMKAFASNGATNIGLLVSASDYAIKAMNGVFAGLRLPIVNKSTDYATIGEYETVVIFDTGTQTKHIKLPQNPSEGEIHLIVQNNSASYVISTADNRKMYGRGNDNGTTSLSVNSRNSWLQVLCHDGSWFYKQIN